MSESDWSPVPGVETLGTLTKQVTGYVGLPTDDEATEVAVACIRRAIDKINMRRWNWTIAYQDIQFVVGTAEYGAEPDMKAPRKFVLIGTDDLEAGLLTYIPWSEFVDRLSYEATTHPCEYSLSNLHANGVITLNGTVASDWVAQYPTARLWYYRRVLYPSAASDVVDVPSEFNLYLSEYAKGCVAETYNAPGKAQSAYVRAELAMRDLIRDDNEIQPDWEGMR